MGRLNYALGIAQRTPFKINGSTYRCVDEECEKLIDEVWTTVTDANELYEMLDNANKLKVNESVSELCLSEKQITAIKGRIAEGTPWVARDNNYDKYHEVSFFENRPSLIKSEGEFYDVSDGNGVDTTYTNRYGEFYSYMEENDIYDFVTFHNSPIYLPDLLKEVNE